MYKHRPDATPRNPPTHAPSGHHSISFGRISASNKGQNKNEDTKNNKVMQARILLSRWLWREGTRNGGGSPSHLISSCCCCLCLPATPYSAPPTEGEAELFWYPSLYTLIPSSEPPPSIHSLLLPPFPCFCLFCLFCLFCFVFPPWTS